MILNKCKGTNAAGSCLLWTILLTLLATSVVAAPPHPSLLEQSGAEKSSVPYFLEHLSDLRAKGIGKPSESPFSKSVEGAAMAPSAIGTFKALAILVHFSDQVSSVAASKFDSLLFDSVGNTVRDYYDEISYGQLDIVTVNLPSTIGWQMAPQTYAYYVNNQNGVGSYPQNSQKLVEDLVDQIDAQVDFSQYDNDGDGYVDVVMVIHSGSGAEYTGSNSDIWSHKWEIFPRLKDGVNIKEYTVQPEFWTTPGDMTIGVYAHELGHVFGLPDLYDTDYSSNGIGRWGVMSFGSWLGPALMGSSPAHPSAWCRIQMGFAAPVNVTTNRGAEAISPVEQGGSIYRLWNSGAASNEYFLIENRQKTGYDAYLPGHGLLIWHIDKNKPNNTQEWYTGQPGANHYLVGLEQADGLFELEQTIDQGDAADPFPGTGGKTGFNTTSLPNSDSYLSGATLVSVGKISESGSVITADLNVGIAASINDNVNQTVAEKFQLKQNYPNPFNPSTSISFDVKINAQVQLVVYNVVGQVVATLLDAPLTPGEHTVLWDTKDGHGGGVSSGVYFYRLTVANTSETKKMILLR